MKGKKKSKLKIILITLIILILAAGATGVYITYNIVRYMTDITRNPAIENQTTLYSYDEAYTMNVLIELVEHTSENQIHYVNIIIIDNAIGEEVYAIRNEYRVFDFHWVDWEEDSYDFSLYSGDLGAFYYEYQGDSTWEKHSRDEKAVVEQIRNSYSEALYSYDEVYGMNVTVEKRNKGSTLYADISIFDNATGKEIFVVKGERRAIRFRQAKWEENSYNFLINIKGLGNLRYEYQGDGTWERHVIGEETKNDTNYSFVK